MNLEESNSFVEQMEKNKKHKKTVLTTIIICAVLVVVLLALIGYMKYQDSLKLKVFVDGKTVSFSNHFFEKQGETDYINIKELAGLLGYSYQKGEYKKYTEDANSCYLRTPYEIVSMVADENTLTKYILNEREATESKENERNQSNENTTVDSNLIVTDETGAKSLNILVDSKNETAETLAIAEPIVSINNELYVSFEEVERVFNVQLDVSQQNRVRISSLTNLIVLANQYAQKAGYSQISNVYENLTAIVDGMIVVSDGRNFGVVDVKTGQELISLKYEKIKYMQNTSEFLVTAEGSVGIVSQEGQTIIKPTEYDDIAVLDEVGKLYLVEKDGKFGVLNGDGDIVVYSEYDSIGIQNKEDFQKEGIRNFSLLFDELIPVNVDGKTGLIDKAGNEIFKPVYTLGYVAGKNVNSTETEEEKRTNTNTTNTVQNKTVEVDEHDNVLTIPESTGIRGIVVKNYNDLYGIYDARSKKLIPCSFTKIYSKTKAGVTTYYLEYNDQEMDLEMYLTQSGFLNENVTNEQNPENDVEE